MQFNRKIEFIIGLKTRNGLAMVQSNVVDYIVVPTLESWGIDGFSITKNKGYWKGMPEASITITVFCNDTDRVARFTEGLAAQFANLCEQECVLFSTTEVNAGLGYGVWK